MQNEAGSDPMAPLDTLIRALKNREPRAIGRALSMVEEGVAGADTILAALDDSLIAASMVLGITGPPGAGKSTLTNQLITRYRSLGRRIGIIAIDPTSPVSGGAILGDRIRMMQHAMDPDVVVRSMASRGRLGGLCAAAGAAVRILAGSGCSPIIIETVGVGQSEMDIIRLADITALVLAPGLGDDIQTLKAGLLEVADLLIVNKADRPGAQALAMDLEGAARGSGGRRTPVCLTSGHDGTGIDEMLSVLESIAARQEQSGERQRRRQQAIELEILDWTLELIRPRLLTMVKQTAGAAAVDPQTAARKIIRAIFPKTGTGS
jgi:LAO/AO transport system kinase